MKPSERIAEITELLMQEIGVNAKYLYYPLLLTQAKTQATIRYLDEQAEKFRTSFACHKHNLTGFSDAYLRIRTMLNAFDTPYAPTGEQVWAHTEEKLSKLKAELEAQKVKAEKLVEAIETTLDGIENSNNLRYSHNKLKTALADWRKP